MLNKQGEGKISWADWSWNVIAGCQHACSYCYCKRFAKRFNRDFTKYAFRENYLKDLKSKKLKPGDKIFVGSSGDMFGDWVPKNDIQMVIDAMMLWPEYIFIFLTKNPKRYKDFVFPENCWLGTTVENDSVKAQERLTDFYRGKKLYACNENHIHFVSFEPLQCDLSHVNITWLDWIIIGADSNPGAVKPPAEWADKLIERAQKYNIKVFVKDNYKYHTRRKQWPN